MPVDKDAVLNGNGTRDEAIQRPDRTIPKPQPKTEPVEEKQEGPIAQVEATQAEDSAAKILDLAMQSKVEGLQQAAERGANQATEEVLTEFTAYANVLLQGTEAATSAKAALREGLNQSAAPGTVGKDFSNFFRLKTAVKPAIDGGKS